jgi:hypothetical protein
MDYQPGYRTSLAQETLYIDFYHRESRLFGVDSRALDARACASILGRLTPVLKQVPSVPLSPESTVIRFRTR